MITGCRNGTADLSISQTHARLLTARAQMEEMITGRDGKTIWLEEPHHLVPFVDAFARLSPPGNRSHTGSDLDVLDDWTWSGDTVIVKDYSDQRCSLDARSAPSQTVEDSTDRAHPVTCNPAAGANMLQVEGPLWSTYGALVYGDAAHNVDLPTLEWHPETTLLMSQWLTTQLGAFEKFIIYTDGSAGSQREGTEQIMKAHWAYAVWALVSEQRQLIHFDRGHVVTDHNDEGWHGTLRATSLEAERAALIAASVWANRDLAAYRLPIEFCFDNVAAGFGSSGQWKIQRSQSDAILLRCMMQTLEERLGQQPVFIHVHAHTGDAYNEFVDTLAYDALKKNVLGAPIDFDVRQVLKGDHPECAHWPLLARTTRPTTTMPAFCNNGITWNYQTSTPNPEVVWRDLGSVREQSVHERLLQLRCATYNVKTLKDNGDGLSAFLRAQLADRKFDVLFLQESRARVSCTQETSDYRRYISAANTQGHGGTEIWLSKRTRWTPENTLPWTIPKEAVVLTALQSGWSFASTYMVALWS